MPDSPVAFENPSSEETGALRYEPFPLLSKKERKAGEKRPIVLFLIAAGKNGAEAGLVLAWSPGALKPSDGAPQDASVWERFKEAKERGAVRGSCWLPEELGEAAAQLSSDLGFRALFEHEAFHWDFGHTRSGLTSAGQTRGDDALDASASEAAVRGWAERRLSSFTLTVEEGFYEQMAENENAIEQRVIQGLAVQKEACQLERAVKKCKAAPRSTARRAGL